MRFRGRVTGFMQGHGASNMMQGGVCRERIDGVWRNNNLEDLSPVSLLTQHSLVNYSPKSSVRIALKNKRGWGGERERGKALGVWSSFTHLHSPMRSGHNNSPTPFHASAILPAFTNSHSGAA